MAELIAPVGPLFGPNFVVVSVEDEGLSSDKDRRIGRPSYALQVFADALNPHLRDAGLPTQYYYQPARAYLARRQDSDDYAFGMFIYKGLMAAEAVLGVGDQAGDVETGGGWCTFTTTFAVPDWVIEATRKQIKSHEYGLPGSANGGVVEKYFNYDPNADMPEPRLGAIPITTSTTSIEIPKTETETDSRASLKMTAQGAGKGSIEAHGFNTFHVTCNQLAAGAVAGSIKGGVSPFTIRNELQEQFYATETTIRVVVDVEKVHSTFSAAISVGGFLGIDTLSASAVFEQCLTNGGVTTTIVKGDVSDEMNKWIQEQSQDMRTKAFSMVKDEIFDWKPASPTEASNDRGWFANLFGGALVSLKATYSKKAIDYKDELTIVGPIARTHTVSGDLGDLAAAFAQSPDKYLTVADIAEWFKKVQVGATCNVFLRENVPIASVHLAALYPDYNEPEIDGRPNFVTRNDGEHYVLGGEGGGTRTSGLARWTKDNARDCVNLSFLRLDKEAAGWPPNRVKLRKTIAFNPADSRVAMKAGEQFVAEWTSEDHAPVLGLTEIGYTAVNFSFMPRITNESLLATLEIEFGDRRESLELNSTNKGVLLWELYSDKYFDVTSLAYKLQVLVAGPDITYEPVILSGDKTDVQLSSGSYKSADVQLTVPPVPADKVATVRQYLAAATATTTA